MPQLKTQKELRSAHSLNFCYLCGKCFSDEPNRACDDDHVPPTALFPKPDRDAPLILKTHKDCNNSQNLTDEFMGQLVSLLHGKEPRPNRLNTMLIPARSLSPKLFVEADLKSAIWRWIRGFHAALYQEYLPDNTVRAIHPPMPSFKRDGNRIVLDERLGQHIEFVKELKKNRKAGRVDLIACRNGKCIYECVWTKADDGSWVCCFALQIYKWKKLGSEDLPPRSCVGLYMPVSGCPIIATKGVKIEIPYSNRDPFDAFGR